MSLITSCLKLFLYSLVTVIFQVSLPASVYRVECGVDHTVALARSYSWSDTKPNPSHVQT